jgi:hypothetical protein
MHSIIADFKMVFPDEDIRPISDYLTGIGRRRLLDVSSHFLGLQSKRDLNLPQLFKFIEDFFCAENVAIAQQIFDRLKQVMEEEKTHITILHPATMLQLFQLGFTTLNDENTQLNPEAELSIFKAIFALNTELVSKEPLAKESSKDANGEPKPAPWFFSQSFPYYDIAHQKVINSFICQTIKAVYFFEFLEANDSTKILLKKFLDDHQCETWNDYLQKLLPSIHPALPINNKEGRQVIQILNDEKFDANYEFLKRFLYGGTPIPETDFDFITIRNQPFYETEMGSFTVTFSLFLTERIFKGQYYTFETIYNNLDVADRNAINATFKIGDFRSFYCDYFSEQHLLYELLKRTYKKKHHQVTGSKMAESMDGGIDYYLLKGNTLCLFESKDVRIDKQVKVSYDYTKYEPALIDKFYYSIKGNKKKARAVLQLANNINLALTNKLPLGKSYKPYKLKIYPILVVHDFQFTAIGLNKIMDHWFEQELNQIRSGDIDVNKVKPLTIIDIDSLIIYSQYVADEKVSLEEFIDGYRSSITVEPSKYSSKEAYKRALWNEYASFAYYMSYRYKPNVKKLFREKGLSLFNENEETIE